MPSRARRRAGSRWLFGSLVLATGLAACVAQPAPPPDQAPPPPPGPADRPWPAEQSFPGPACLNDPGVTNRIACENTASGNPASEWDIAGSGSASIQGFATAISVNRGET